MYKETYFLVNPSILFVLAIILYFIKESPRPQNESMKT